MYEYTYKGKKLTSEQDPFLDGLNGEIWFAQYAKDEDGESYLLKWHDIANPDAEEMDEMGVDWTNYTVRDA